MKKNPFASDLENLDRKINDLRQKLVAAEEERQEIATAYDVFERKFGGGRRRKRTTRLSPPTVPEMAKAILTESYPDGVGARTIEQTIKSRWLPDLKMQTLMTSLTRMRIRGEVRNQSRKWYLVGKPVP